MPLISVASIYGMPMDGKQIQYSFSLSKYIETYTESGLPSVKAWAHANSFGGRGMLMMYR